MRRPPQHRHLRELRADRSRLTPTTPPGPTEARSIDDALTDCAVYDKGRREGGVLPLTEALERAYRTEDGFVWIGVHPRSPRPSRRSGPSSACTRCSSRTRSTPTSGPSSSWATG